MHDSYYAIQKNRLKEEEKPEYKFTQLTSELSVIFKCFERFINRKNSKIIKKNIFKKSN